MNYNVEANNLVGGFLPSIYINTVDISISNKAPRSKNKEAHTTKPSDFSNFNSKVGTDTLDAGALNVKLNMSLKSIDLKELSLPERTLKYLKIMVVQCLSEVKHKEISSHPIESFYSILNNPDKKDLEQGAIKTKILPFSQYVSSEYNSSSGIDLLGRTITEDNKSSISFGLETTAEGVGFYSIPIEAEFEIEDSEGGSEVSFLSYFAFCYYDKYQKQINRGRMNSGSKVSDVMCLGKISSEVVITNKTVNKNSYAFKTSQGRFWTGHVHQMKNGEWMKYSSHTSGEREEIYLSKIDVDNVKVRDHRIYDKIMSLKFDFFDKEKEILQHLKNPAAKKMIEDMFKKQAKPPSAAQLFIKKKKYFSDLFITRDQSGNARFLFSADIEQILMDNTGFGMVLQNLKKTDFATYQDILRKTKITNITLLRKRVLRENQITSKQLLVKTDDSEAGVIIAQSADNPEDPGVLQAKQYSSLTRDPLGINTKPEVSGLIEQVNLVTRRVSEHPGERHYTGTDFNVASSRAGTYQYSLEISINDPITDYVKGAVQDVKRILLGNSSGLGMVNYLTTALNGGYKVDPKVKHFESSFINEYNSNFNSSQPTATINDNFLFRSLKRFVKILYQFSDGLESKNITQTSVLNYLTNISSPTVGSPSGVLSLVVLMSLVEKKLEGLLRTHSKFVKFRGDVTTEVNPSNSSTQGGAAGKTFQVEHTFDQLFDSNTLPGVGYEYLFTSKDEREKNLDGLALFSKKEMLRRFSLETTKYFKTNTSGIEIQVLDTGNYINKGDQISNTKFSFLSPSAILLEQEDENVTVHDLSTSLRAIDPVTLNVALTQVSLINKNKNEFYGGKTRSSVDKTQQKLQENFGAFKGTSIAVNHEQKKIKAKSKIGAFNANAAADLVDRDENLFTKEQEKADRTALSEEVTNLMTAMNHISDSVFLSDKNAIKYYLVDDPKCNGVYKKNAQIFAIKASSGKPPKVKRQYPFNHSPNQIKALVLSLQKSESVNNSDIFKDVTNNLATSTDPFRDPANAGFIFFNYKNVRRIEVFTGFGPSSMKKPIWKPLDQESLDGAGSGGVLFCRHSKYTNSEIGIEESDELYLPTYNEYFFISQDTENDSGTAAGGTFILQSLTRSPGSSTPANNTYNKNIDDFFIKRSLTTEPNSSNIGNIVKSEFVSTTTINKRTNLTKMGVRSIEREGSRRAAVLEINKRNTASSAKELVRLGLASLVGSRALESARSFGSVSEPREAITERSPSPQPARTPTPPTSGDRSNDGATADDTRTTTTSAPRDTNGGRSSY